eukprot:c17117_g1_i1 orf=968-4012(-)
MGKRRDRRQQQASSRRVKLDLSTDDVLLPSETPGSLEVLDSALGEEVKAGAKNQEVANDNPLSLLGQYSDDEADDDDDPDTGPLDNIGSEAGNDSSKSEDEKENAAITSVTAKTSLDEKQTTNNHVVGGDEQESKSLLVPETTMQDVVTDSEWQAVLHEDTGEYYYWNVRTGETTWVKPVLLESESAGELESSGNRPGNLDMSSVISPGQLQGMHTGDDRGESGDLDSVPTCESGSQNIADCLLPFKDANSEKTVTCLDSSTSLQIELDSLKAQTQLVSDGDDLEDGASTKVEKCEVLGDPECKVGSDGSIQGDADNEPKEVQGEEKDNRKTSSAIKDDGEDSESEAVDAILGALERNSQQERACIKNETESGDRSFPLACESLQGADMGNVTFSDVQDASECTRNSFYTKEGAQGTIEEKMAPLAEKGEALQQRLNILARESLGGVSRHACMALQTEARIMDWKAFCALGFVPEACLSFIQNELTQLDLVLAAEEAAELERQKVFQSTLAVEASHEVAPATKDADWPLNWGYYQQECSTVPELWKQGQPIDILGNGEEVEEGEIQTSYGEIHPAYASIPEGTIAINNLKVSHFASGEDVDMDVDMEVDDEVEAEPAVPGMSSDMPLHEAPVPFSHPYSLPGSSGAGTLAPLYSTHVGESTQYFPIGLSGDSWAPPLPPDDEWAPPPPGETEPAPPPPPDDSPPLPPHSPQTVETFSMPSVPSEVQVHYFVPEYTIDNDSLPQCIPAPDYQSVYGAYVEDVPGVVYSNSPQLTETLKVEQPYVVASGSTPAFNGWTAPVLAPTPSLFSEAPVKSSSNVPSIPTTASTTADSSVGGAIMEAKKLAKGKIKKKAHAVAAAPMLNKKVSSLVNKWKQAKEELHGGEDDEDDKALYDVEVLEKKRKKEIEEWRRQQIASGEALDNANFQPLGTDWRERVKRAKKSDSQERNEGDTRSEAPLSTVGGQNLEAVKSQKPNLSDLSKGLPAGWQAYWDEASAEVYYGNLITQETTWDRPVT